MYNSCAPTSPGRGRLRRPEAPAGRRRHQVRRGLHADQPIHAVLLSPLEPSPYLPESRRFLNVTVHSSARHPRIRPLNAEARAKVDALHDRVAATMRTPARWTNAVWDAQATGIAYPLRRRALPRNAKRSSRTSEECRPRLDSFAAWEPTLRSVGRAVGRQPLVQGDHRFQRSRATAHRRTSRSFDLDRWLQWIATEQVNDAQQTALLAPAWPFSA